MKIFLSNGNIFLSPENNFYQMQIYFYRMKIIFIKFCYISATIVHIKPTTASLYFTSNLAQLVSEYTFICYCFNLLKKNFFSVKFTSKRHSHNLSGNSLFFEPLFVFYFELLLLLLWSTWDCEGSRNDSTFGHSHITLQNICKTCNQR